MPISATARQLADRLGMVDVDEASELKPGLGGTELWRLHRRSGDLVLRAFAADHPFELAAREAAAHESARAAGVSAPAVVACDQVDGRPVLVIEWVEGDLLSDLLWRGEPADDLGRRCAAVLARLHRISSAPPVITDRGWLDWAGDRADELRPLLTGHRGDSLLHLDFHPQNLIMDRAGVITVLDWANVRLGPPAADLARTDSILDLITAAVPGVTDENRAVIESFRAGFFAGYADVTGDAAVPDPLAAWAAAVQIDDLAGSWVPEAYFDHLRHRYRELITRAAGPPHR